MLASPLLPRIGAIALLLATACARPAAPVAASSPADRPTVILLAFDGLRADDLDRQPLPNFTRLASAGVRARGLIPTFPSKTFPNHYTIVTGLHAGRHGIVANTFWDPARAATFAVRDTAVKNDGRWYGGEPIWVAAERQGVRTATAAYPGAEAEIGGLRPSTYLNYDERTPEDVYVDSVGAWLRRPPITRPHFVAIYVDDVDQAGHRSGPGTPGADSAVAAADQLLGRLLDTLAASPLAGRANVVVVSDHGMLSVPREQIVDVGRLVDLTGVRVADPGPVLSLWFDGDAARRDRTHAALTRALADARVPARVYRRADTPARWRVRDQPRVGDLLVVAEPGWMVTPRPLASPSPGQHGWDAAATAAMHGVFVAAGPNVRAAGVIDAFESVHVYPFLAALLRVRAAAGTDGEAAVLDALRR